MAYSNWEADVFKNGIRQPNRVDVGVFDEDEADVDREKKGFDCDNDFWEHSHHAVLGSGPVRLCAYKTTPCLYAWGKGLDKPEEVLRFPGFNEAGYRQAEGSYRYFYPHDIDEKYIWKFAISECGWVLVLYLKEPNGTVWTAVANYRWDYFEEDDRFEMERLKRFAEKKLNEFMGE